MGSLSGWTMGILKKISPFSPEQFICIPTNHPGCRNIHREMQWRCAQGTQILGSASGYSFSIFFRAGTGNTHTSDLNWYLLCSVVLQPIPGMQEERQASGSPGEQWWSWFYQHLGSGCSVWQWCWYMKHMWGQWSAHVAWFAHCLVIFSFLQDKCKEGAGLCRGWEMIFCVLQFCFSWWWDWHSIECVCVHSPK